VTQDREHDDRALQRATDEAEKSFGPLRSDPPTDDPIEQLGRRIGRALSILLAFALIAYFWYSYLAR
jgi:hypothetical protein